MTPTVSVITIFLDAERFFEEALASVFAQELDDWELLLVDDGSTDGSTAIACAATRDPRVRYLEHAGHENRGMSASRNLALRHARGRYVALLDADDVWFPTTLAKQVAALDAHPEAAMAFGSTQFWWSWRSDPAKPDWIDWAGRKVARPNSVVRPPELMALLLEDRGAVPSPCSVVYRADALRAVGGFEDDFRDLHEDQVVYAKIFLEQPVYVAEEVLARYRQHDGQACVQAERAGTFAASERRFFAWLAAYLDRRGVEDERLLAALASAGDALAASVADA
jgi:glycosyltransferase involved in cell wall biosynthesis